MTKKKVIALMLAGAMSCLTAMPVMAGRSFVEMHRTGFSQTQDNAELMEATLAPTPSPSASPSADSNATFGPQETAKPTEEPIAKQTEEPTEKQTEEPIAEQTEAPTEEPTEKQTEEPIAEQTTAPTEEPTEKQTEEPETEQTTAPTEEPTEKQTEEPITEQTEAPETEQTAEPETEQTAAPTEKPTAKPTEIPEPDPVWYNDNILSAYAGDDDYITAEVLGLNVMAVDSDIYTQTLGNALNIYNQNPDPYIRSKTLRTVTSSNSVVVLEPNIIFGNSSDYAAAEKAYAGFKQKEYSSAYLESEQGYIKLDDTLRLLENYVGVVNGYASMNGMSTRYKLNEVVKDANEYYRSMAYVMNRLSELKYDKRTVVILDIDSMKAYGSESGIKGAEYFRTICYNAADDKGAKSYSCAADAELINKADIIVTADFSNYTEGDVRDKLSKAGVDVGSKKILSCYPDGVVSMKTNSIESLAGFAYCTGFAYYDIDPDTMINPVAMCAYFYTNFLHINENNIQSFMTDIMGSASLPDGVSVTNVDFSGLGNIIYYGNQYYEKNGFDIEVTDVKYGDFFEDGKVNMKDQVYLMNYVQEEQFIGLGVLPGHSDTYNELSPSAKEAAECIKDGDIDIRDVQALFYYISELYDELAKIQGAVMLAVPTDSK